MRARLLVNLLLAAVVAGLVAVLVLEPGVEEQVPRALSELEPAAVSRVRIEPRGRESFELERRGEAWWLRRSPQALPADPFRVQALLGVLRATSHSQFPAAGEDLARFGLAPPRVRLLVEERELAFGDTESLDDRRYVLFDDEVHLVEDAQFPHLSARPENFVHPSPLGPGAEPVELDLPGLRLRRGARRWESEPERPDLGADARVTLVDAWTTSRALRVSAFDDDGAWGERVRLTLAAAPEPLEIEVWDAGHEVILGRRDVALQWHFVRRVGDRLLAREP